MQASNAKVINNYASFVQGQYISVAARALFLWDYFVTLDREVKFVWKSRFSAASALFLLNRYVNLLITILELIVQASFQTPESCPPVVRVLQSLLVFATLIVAGFVTLRVYATWSRNWRPALPVLILALVTPTCQLYLDIIGDPIPAPHPSVGCAIRTNVDPYVYSKIIIAERASTTAYDFLLLLFTIMKTAQVRKAALSLEHNTSSSLLVLLLRDGTMYFLILLVINVAQIIISAEIAGNNFISFFISPLTSILISRFLLNLRQIAHLSSAHAGLRTTAGSRSGSGSTETTDTAVMSSGFELSTVRLSDEILGNMGAPLRSMFDPENTDVCDTENGVSVEKVGLGLEDSLEAVTVVNMSGDDDAEEQRSANDIEMQLIQIGSKILG